MENIKTTTQENSAAEIFTEEKETARKLEEIFLNTQNLYERLQKKFSNRIKEIEFKENQLNSTVSELRSKSEELMLVKNELCTLQKSNVRLASINKALEEEGKHRVLDKVTIEKMEKLLQKKKDRIDGLLKSQSEFRNLISKLSAEKAFLEKSNSEIKKKSKILVNQLNEKNLKLSDQVKMLISKTEVSNKSLQEGEAKYYKLEKEYQRLKNQLIKNEGNFQNVRNEYSQKLFSLSETYKKNLEVLNQRLLGEEHLKRVQQLESLIDDRAAKHEEERAKLTEKVRQLEEKVESDRSIIVAAGSKEKKYLEKIKVLNEKIEEKVSAIKSIEIHYETMLNDRAELRERLVAYKQELIKVNNSLKEYKECEKKSTEETSSLQEVINTLKKTNGEYQNQLIELKEQKANAERDLVDLNKQFLNLSESYELQKKQGLEERINLEKQIRELLTVQESMRVQRNEKRELYQSKIQHWKTHCETVTKQVAVLEGEKQVLLEKHEYISNQLKIERKALSEKRVEFDELQKRNRSEVRELNENINHLKSSLESQEQKMVEFEQESHRIGLQLEKAKAEYSDEVQSFHVQLQGLKDNNQRLKNQVDILEKEYKKSKNDLLDERNNSLSSQKYKYEEMLENQSKKIEEAHANYKYIISKVEKEKSRLQIDWEQKYREYKTQAEKEYRKQLEQRERAWETDRKEYEQKSEEYLTCIQNLQEKLDAYCEREIQLNFYSQSIDKNKTALKIETQGLIDEIKGIASLSPLKNYLSITEREISKVEIDLGKLPLHAQERPRLEEILGSLIRQRDTVRIMVEESDVKIQRKIKNIIKVSQSESLMPLPPLPPKPNV